MTVEIKQLIVRARVDATPTGAAKPTASSAVAPAAVAASPSAGLHYEQLEREREAIVAACVREVMRRLERKRER
jgi:hypothetical protein